MEPLRPLDHMGPQPIIKVKVRENVIPPVMVCSRLVFPLFTNPMEGSLGDLSNFSSAFLPRRNKERNYLERRWIMSPSRQQGILFVAESSNVPEKPTCGQQDSQTGPLPKGHSLDDWMLEQRH